MAQDVSILITGKDNFSSAITTMRNSGQRFNKDLDGLQKKLDELNKTKVNLKVDVNKALEELKAAEKQFKKTGEAVDKSKLETANANYEQAARNLRLVSKEARQAEKDMLSLGNASRKNENRAGGGKSDSLSSLSKTLAASGAYAMLGNTASQMANAYVGSAYGGAAGNVFSSMLSGAGTGAAIGTALGGPVGTAIGAALGGVVGAVQGQVQNAQEKDESFKSYYQDLYTQVTDEQKTMLSSGSAIAAGRETERMSFTTLLGGEDKAEAYLSQVRAMDAVTPFSYNDLSSMSKTLLTYFSEDQILPLLTKVGDTGAALGMSTDSMERVAVSLGRMESSGKATLEYLNPMIERGIPVWDYLVQATGKTKAQVQAMVSKGLIPGGEAARMIADAMGEANKGAMELQANTYSGLVGQVEAAQDELSNAMGEGFNERRKAGLTEQIDFLGGETGTKMEDAYRKIGQFQASLVNQQEQAERDVFDSVMNGTLSRSLRDSKQRDSIETLMSEYKNSKQKYNEASMIDDFSAIEAAEAEMGRILAEAKAIAYNEYNAGPGAQLQQASMFELAERIKNDSGLDSAYWDAGYKMGQQFSEGLANRISAINLSDIALGIQAGDHDGFGNYTPKPKGEAYGMSFVPYDNFPALLHHGERVLTASENRNYSEGAGAAPVSFAGAAFYVREEADIDKITSRIVERLIRAKELSV